MRLIKRGGPLLLADQSAFFLEAYQRFVQSNPNPCKCYLSLNERIIELSFATEELLELLIPALGHLIVPKSAPSIRICIWEGIDAISGCPWTSEEVLDRGKIRGWGDDRYSFNYQPNICSLSMFDRTGNLALFWMKNSRSIPSWEWGSPLHLIFHWILEAQGAISLHGAAVGLQKGGVLLPGKGGSGKSTTALCCLASDLLYASDDYCFFASGSIGSLYTSGKVHWEILPQLEHLKAPPRTADAKALFFLYPEWKDRLIRHFPLKAILVPRISRGMQTQIIPCSSAEALIALAPSSMFQLAGPQQSSFEKMAQLARSLPCYFLNLGPIASDAPQKIYAFLEELC